MYYRMHRWIQTTIGKSFYCPMMSLSQKKFESILLILFPVSDKSIDIYPPCTPVLMTSFSFFFQENTKILSPTTTNGHPWAHSHATRRFWFNRRTKFCPPNTAIFSPITDRTRLRQPQLRYHLPSRRFLAQLEGRHRIFSAIIWSRLPQIICFKRDVITW